MKQKLQFKFNWEVFGESLALFQIEADGIPMTDEEKKQWLKEQNTRVWSWVDRTNVSRGRRGNEQT